ncbi:hypothetical protein EMIT0111MI5_80043 [Burkholderia sp. IT-111MI5]
MRAAANPMTGLARHGSAPGFRGFRMPEIVRRGGPGCDSLSMALRPHPLFGRLRGRSHGH